jgi:hypothetical protein
MKRHLAFLVLLAVAAVSVAPSVSAAPAALQVRVIVQVANIRSGPDIGAAVVRTAVAGTIFPVIRKLNDWYLIGIPGGGQGYINQTVVEEVAEAAVPDQPAVAPPKPSAPAAPAPLQAQPPVVSAAEPKIYVRAGYDMGFAEAKSSLSFTRTAYYETASYGLDYGLKKGGSIDGAVGYMFSPRLGVEVGASMTNRDISESTSFSVPHPLWMGYPRTGTVNGSGLKLKEIDLYLNLVFSLRFSMFGVSLYGGPCYMMAAATIISDVAIAETGYPYMEISVSLPTAEIKKNVVGFDGGAALSVHFGRSIALVLDARYVGGTGAFKPAGDIPELKLALGGLRAGGGLKLQF